MRYVVTNDRLNDIARRLHRVVDCQAFEREQRMGQLLDYAPEGVDAIRRILATEQRRTQILGVARFTALWLGGGLLALLMAVSTAGFLAGLLPYVYLIGLDIRPTRRQHTAAGILARVGPPK